MGAKRLLGAAVCVAFLLVVSSSAWPALGQEQPEILAWITYWTIEPHSAAKLEEAIKKHNAFHKAQNDPNSVHTWQILTGKMTGHYMRGVVGQTWADFDAPGVDEVADAADVRATIEPYIASSKSVIYQFWPDLSRLPEDGTQKLARVIHFGIKMGSQGKFKEAVGKAHEAIGQSNWPVTYAWYEIVDGGSTPTFVLVLPEANWAGFAAPEKSFDKMMGEVYGAEEAGKIMAAIGESIESEYSFTVSHREDLSYLPAPK